MVAASSPLGRFSGVATAVSEHSLLDLFEQLRLRGQGYLEVSWQGSEYPMLAVGLSGMHAVIHLFERQDSVCLLQGDGSSTSEIVEVQIINELASFEGVFAVSVDNVQPILEQFANGELPQHVVRIPL